MKKICLVVVGLYVNLLSAMAQKADSAWQNRKLSLEEVNFVSSYYHQEGNNSAVTGGTGTEKLTDFANSIDIKLTKYDRKQRKHSFTLDAGIDYYSSASSDQIDLKANSSASSSDLRIYPSVAWNVANESKGSSFGLNASSSIEFDYTSVGFGASFTKKSKDNNRELGLKGQVYLDQVSLIYPLELRTGGGRGDDYSTSARNSYSGSLTLSQVVNKRLQVAAVLELVRQQGFLGLPFHRVYLNTGAVKSELLPSTRLKIPLGFRASYFLGDRVIIRSFYRFYHDDWGLNAHTIDLETPVKITPFFSVTPFYRHYRQTAVDYFAAYKQHTAADAFYTSNYDLSNFNSSFYGTGVRIAPPKGVFGMPHWSMIELRYGHYNRSNGLNSNIISMNLKFK